MASWFAAFWSGDYMPHGYCLSWWPALLWTHVTADALIALAYFSIPAALVTLVQRRKDMAFGWLFWCFATFILACGLTHVMGIVTLWLPLYGLEAAIKLVTAFASIPTTIILWLFLPKAVALPSAGRLQAANQRLEALITERDSALAELRAQIAGREAAEAALVQAKKMEAIGQITGGIAHDFNNLLQAVSGNLELITRKPDEPERVRRWAGSALEAAERGRALTGQLLAFSRRQQLNLTAVSLAALIDGMRDLLDRAVSPLSQLHIEPIDPAWHVEGDPLQLELAILNLAINARDAMPRGGTITIDARRCMGAIVPDLPAGDYIALSIRDTGVGMDAEIKARALDPFFTTKSPGRGTGMGLSMAFGVITQSGGTLQIESEPGRGTIVTLFLRAATRRQTDAANDMVRPSAGADLSRRRIALVEDDEQVRAALADMLRTAGATVIEAGDGEAGVALVANDEPDLLIVDFAMPMMSGVEVVHHVRKQRPTLPVLVITGLMDAAKLDELGEFLVLYKPFEGEELLSRVADLLD